MKFLMCTFGVKTYKQKLSFKDALKKKKKQLFLSHELDYTAQSQGGTDCLCRVPKCIISENEGHPRYYFGTGKCHAGLVVNHAGLELQHVCLNVASFYYRCGKMEAHNFLRNRAKLRVLLSVEVTH